MCGASGLSPASFSALEEVQHQNVFGWDRTVRLKLEHPITWLVEQSALDRAIQAARDALINLQSAQPLEPQSRS
jgi:hypothetical protein